MYKNNTNEIIELQKKKLSQKQINRTQMTRITQKSAD